MGFPPFLLIGPFCTSSPRILSSHGCFIKAKLFHFKLIEVELQKAANRGGWKSLSPSYWVLLNHLFQAKLDYRQRGQCLNSSAGRRGSSALHISHLCFQEFLIKIPGLIMEMRTFVYMGVALHRDLNSACPSILRTADMLRTNLEFADVLFCFVFNCLLICSLFFLFVFQESERLSAQRDVACRAIIKEALFVCDTVQRHKSVL